MNINDELAELRAQADKITTTPRAMSEAASYNSFLESCKLNDEAKVNSMQGVRRASGILEMRGAYYPDTMVDVGRGIMARVDSAIAAGLIPADTLGKPIDNGLAVVDQDAPITEDTKPIIDTSDQAEGDSTFDISDLASAISQDMKVQANYVENVIGESANEQLLTDFYSGQVSEDHPSIKALAVASGLSIQDAIASAKEVAEARIQPLAKAFEQLVGTNVDFDHAMSWLQSSAVTAKDRALVKTALATNNGTVLNRLAMSYKAYNSQAN